MPVPLVLQVVQSLGGGRAEATPLHRTFSLTEVYAQADRLARLHSGEPAHELEKRKWKMEIRNTKIEIRQQLQVLRDLGLVTFLGGGCYRLR